MILTEWSWQSITASSSATQLFFFFPMDINGLSSDKTSKMNGEVPNAYYRKMYSMSAIWGDDLQEVIILEHVNLCELPPVWVWFRSQYPLITVAWDVTCIHQPYPEFPGQQHLPSRRVFWDFITTEKGTWEHSRTHLSVLSVPFSPSGASLKVDYIWIF